MAVKVEFSINTVELEVACVASVSVQFGSKELQGDEWRGRKEGNACRQTPGF